MCCTNWLETINGGQTTREEISYYSTDIFSFPPDLTFSTHVHVCLYNIFIA